LFILETKKKELYTRNKHFSCDEYPQSENEQEFQSNCTALEVQGVCMNILYKCSPFPL